MQPSATDTPDTPTPAHPPQDAHPPLLVRGLVKSYPGLTAVNRLSFAVPAGQVLAMVGPNGAGKTTTMRCIAGILRPTVGQALIAGIDVEKQPARAKALLAYVPDDPKLFDTLTVWEHFDFIAAAYDLPSTWTDLASQWLDRFELAPKRNTPASDLSRGMRQKVAVIAASIRAPALLMLDEPMTGLDPRGIRTMKDAIRQHAARGAGVVLSSHLLDLVEDLCDGLLIMHKGQSLFAGTVAQARAAFAPGGQEAGQSRDASLEEVFFRATELAPPAPSTPTQPDQPPHHPPATP